MERRIGDHHAADGDRLQPRHRGQRAGAADLDVDGGELGGRLLGRELVGDGPAGRARAQAETVLQGQQVGLVDDAVDIVVEAGALPLDLAIGGKRRVDVGAEPHQRIDRKAPVGEKPHHADLAVGRQGAAHLAPGIGEEAQRARCGDLRVLLAQRAGGGVARIDVERLARRRLLLVEPGEIRLAEIDLAAHLDHLRHAVGQRVRNVADGAHIGGDVLAGDAVAAGGAQHQPAGLVAQRHGQAVDLGLGGERDRLRLGAAEEAVHLGDEIAHVVVGKRVLQRQHGQRMADRGEFSRRRHADPLARAVGAFQLREARLDGRVALSQRVIVGVGDRRRVFGVVAPVVAGDFARQTFKLGRGFRRAQFLDRLRGIGRLRHRRISSSPPRDLLKPRGRARPQSHPVAGSGA